jgi:hypothetical protein
VSQSLTHSRAACFRSCPRKHYLRYELGLTSEEKDLPLRVGSAFARAVEADAKGLDISDAIDAGLTDPFDVALVAAMVHGHRARYEGQALEHVAAELPFQLPLINPETGRPTPTWTLDGKIDRIVRLPDGRLALMEYKTTSRDFAPGADYWMRLHLDMQLSIYLIAARTMGYDISTILYDVTRRPALRPLKATPIEARKYTKDGVLYKAQRDADETPEEYASRCAASIAENVDNHFARIEIARLDKDLEETRAEIWAQQLAIRESQKSGRWYRNPDACFQLNSKCEYLPICQLSDVDTRTPAGFVRLTDVHPELSPTVGG